MKDHALIKKIIELWPSERDLIIWINIRWKPNGHYELQLGSKGFFTTIFYNLEDKDRILENGPYSLTMLVFIYGSIWIDSSQENKTFHMHQCGVDSILYLKSSILGKSLRVLEILQMFMSNPLRQCNKEDTLLMPVSAFT